MEGPEKRKNYIRFRENPLQYSGRRDIISMEKETAL